MALAMPKAAIVIELMECTKTFFLNTTLLTRPRADYPPPTTPPNLTILGNMI